MPSVETPISENKIKVAKLEFDEEDNSDFKLMFAKIPRTKLPKDLILFQEEEEKALGADVGTIFVSVHKLKGWFNEVLTKMRF